MSTVSDCTKYIRNYDFAFLRNKFEEKQLFPDIPFNVVAEALTEFFVMVKYANKPIALVSRPVDELWHLFIIFTPQYRQFCSRAMGFYVDHQPHSPTTPVPSEAITNFFSEYKVRFEREPGEIWLRGVDATTGASLRAGIIPKDLEFKWSGWTGKRG